VETFPGIMIDDGTLNITLQSVFGQPLINAIEVLDD
jgi:hypothetical protein